MKSVFCFILTAAVLVLSACGPGTGRQTQTAEPTAPATPATSTSPSPSGGEGGVITVYTLTDEVLKLIDRYKELHSEFGWEIDTNYSATADSLYEPALDDALKDGGAVDIYCAESQFVTRYTKGEMSGYAMPYEELGIDLGSDIAAADIARYIVDIGTRPGDGKVVGLVYQSTPGAFIYRRSIAREVWGTDDPAMIASKIGPGWDRFFAAAEELKAKDYAIVSGVGDIWRPVENSAEKPWITDGKLYLGLKREAFLDYAKELVDNGYSNDTVDWHDEWYADMAGEGPRPVFGFFGPAWLINYVMTGFSGTEFDEHSNIAGPGGTWGDWAICEPTESFFWGGTWVLANKELEKDLAKKAAVAELIEWMTLDCTEDGLQYAYANGMIDDGYGSGGTKDTVASGTVMEMSDGTLPFLGGQDMFDVFVPAGRDINGNNITEYDQAIYPIWRDKAYEYAHGRCTRQEAIAAFKQEVKEQLGFDAW